MFSGVAGLYHALTVIVLLLLVGSVTIPSVFIGATSAEILSKYNYSIEYVAKIVGLKSNKLVIVCSRACGRIRARHLSASVYRSL